ncbi:AOX, alternative oxidase mitochondrial precursor [Cristinia sonorae]|uniref:Alternative oxidase n=1 Tax=Cristinia sonorae TaxID=1940300 RepID=A0A8K0UTZ8_9AGAR|nr:AOX, alternative oxidase mitochondrial precursor [Cristinia sonorae]
MLRTTLCRTIPHTHVFALAIVSASRRTFVYSAPRMDPALTSKPIDAKATIGTEGPHKKDLPPPSLAAAKGSSAVEEIKGDWVLFHPVYTPDELHAVQVMHREAKTISDKVAVLFVKILRTGFDLISGYKHKEIPPNSSMSLEELRKKGYIMDESQWLSRCLFLESVAGVPGMVGATLRHLRSLRILRRDSGWIHTLLEEAENERMHLMTFMTIKKPGFWFRSLILGAQGVFYNMFFLSYLISPSTCHRFVGHLEEEAVLTYTRCIQEIEAGHLPAWEKAPAPEIAKDYWRLRDDASLLDVIYAIRSDETTHRFVNHSLANLNHTTDVNPFAFREPDMHVKGKKLEFEQEEAEKYVQESHKLIEKATHPTSQSA